VKTMLGEPLRKRTESIRLAVAKILARIFRDPNVLTLLSVVLAAGFIPAHLLHHYWIAWILMISAYLVDAFDGSVARITGKKSRWGNYLDAMVDK
jgi:archaetidylinositol phosphate synthase